MDRKVLPVAEPASCWTYWTSNMLLWVQTIRLVAQYAAAAVQTPDDKTYATYKLVN